MTCTTTYCYLLVNVNITYEEAITSVNSSHAECIENNTYEIVPTLEDRTAMEVNHWIFTIKSNKNGKECFIVMGYSQIPGINYETFSPMACITSMLVLMQLAIQ